MSLDFQQILTQIIGFLTLLFLLKKLFWKPILSVLDSRKAAITKELLDIEEAKKGISLLKAEYLSRLENIENEGREKIQEAIRKGHEISLEIQDKARLDARIIAQKAKESLELEVKKAELELKEKIISLTLLATEKIIQEKVDKDKDKELIEGFLRQIESIP